MRLITAQGESTALDQLGHGAVDRNLLSQEHTTQQNSFQAHETQNQDGWTPEKREMDLQSEASRTLGTDPSRHQSHVVNITHLPQEVLSEIFGFFQHPATDGLKIDLGSIKLRFSKEQHNDIQNLRLACQLFNTLASPLLVPIIRVEVDQPSLDRVLALLKNPLIAAGILAIEVDLRFYFKVLADGFLDFIRYKSKSNFYLWENHFHEKRISEEENARLSGQPVPQEVRETYDLMCKRSRAFTLACKRHVSEQSAQDERLADAQLAEQYYRIIRVAHENYKRKYHDQQRIAKEKLLVKALAKLVSLSGRRVCLSISHTRREYFNRLFPDNQTLSRELEAPDSFYDFSLLCWRPIDADLISQLSIIWDLPIAIHEARGILDGFGLEYLAADRHCRLLCPESSSPSGHKVDRFRAACQHLRTFRFGGLVQRERPKESVAGDLRIGNASIKDFLGTILSSRLLEEVDVRGPLREWDNMPRWLDSRLFGRIISKLHCAHLRTVSLVDISISQRQMLRLCKGMGLKIRRMSLEGILLTDGSWAEVLDALRRAFNKPGLRSRPEISMKDLMGGKATMLREQLAKANATVEDPSTPREILERTMDHKLMELFQAYITSDQITANPGLGKFEL